MSKTVDISEAQAQLPELVSLALAGDDVIISADNKPVARLVPISAASQRRVAGLNQGELWTSDDFDEPLPETFWLGAE